MAVQFRGGTERPTCGPDGRQLAPQTFVRWLIPGVWEDTEGAVHYDVPKLLNYFGWQDTPENREILTETIAEMVREQFPLVTVLVQSRPPEAET